MFGIIFYALDAVRGFSEPGWEAEAIEERSGRSQLDLKAHWSTGTPGRASVTLPLGNSKRGRGLMLAPPRTRSQAAQSDEVPH